MHVRSLFPSADAVSSLIPAALAALAVSLLSGQAAVAQGRDNNCQPSELSVGDDEESNDLPRVFRPRPPATTPAGTDTAVAPPPQIRVLTRVRRPAPTPVFAPAPEPLPEYAPDELVVVNLGTEDLATLLDRGFVVLDQTAFDGLDVTVHLLRIPEGLTLIQARDLVQDLPTGGGVDFNHFYRSVQGAPGSTERTLVGWPAFPSRDAACGGGMEIGMIDSGINENHPTFAGATLEVLRLPHGSDDLSGQVHGTGIAALLVGDPASRSPGLLPGARLVAIDAFYRSGNDERTDTFLLLEGLSILSDRGVKVINLSLAGPDNTALGAIIGQLTLLQDTVVVAAVGNDGPDAAPAYPAAYDPVLAVTAVDMSGRIYDQAVRGAHVDLSAPGVNIWTAASVKGARWKTGTSFAAPFVTAAAAVLRRSNPEMTVAEVAAALRDGARDLGEPGPDSDFGAGLVNLGPLCDPGL